MACAVALTVALATTGCDRVRGEVFNPRATIDRDGAASVVLDGKIFWAFGDTFTPRGGVRSSGAYASLDDPTVVDEPLVNGVPKQLVPFTDAERIDNATSTDGSQWVIWPSELIKTGDKTALVFSTKFHATPDGWVEPALAVSTLTAPSTTTTRAAEPITLASGNYATGIYEAGGYIYLHDCGGANVAPEVVDRVTSTLLDPGLGAINPTPGKCRLARVPKAKALDPTAYRFWSGATWMTTPTVALGVVPGSNSGLSVAWSPKLERYVALSTPGFSSEIRMSTAPRPEGPWTTPRAIYDAGSPLYAVRIHPELSSTDLGTLGVTYFRQDQPGRKGGVVLVDITPS